MMASVLEMDFIMTALIHPLKNALLLSERLGVYLDNPRTEEEVDAIESYIRKFGSLGYTVECTTQLYLDYLLTHRRTFRRHFIQHYINLMDDENRDYVYDLMDKYDAESSLRLLSRMWVVMRVNKIRDRGADTVDELDAPGIGQADPTGTLVDDFACHSRRLAMDYCCLLSMFVRNGVDIPEEPWIHDTWGRFYSDSHRDRKTAIAEAVERFTSMYHLHPQSILQFGAYYCIVQERLQTAAWALERGLQSESRCRLLNAASLLRTSNMPGLNIQLRLVMLVGVLEFLLADSPDTGTGKDGGITDQLVLKVGILVHMDDSRTSLSSTRTRLQQIYRQRWNTLHGNLDDAENKAKENDEYHGDAEYLHLLTQHMLDIICAILRQSVLNKDNYEFILAANPI